MPEKVLYKVEVKESQRTRSYWAQKEQFSTLEEGVRTADVLILPWEDFRDDHEFLYPQGTADFFKSFREKIDAEVFLVAIEADYKEIALHSKAWRLPTLLIDKILLPATASILAMAVYGAIDHISENDSIEINLIIEGDNGKCVDLSYKGPPSRSIDSLMSEAENCFPELKPLPRIEQESVHEFEKSNEPPKTV